MTYRVLAVGKVSNLLFPLGSVFHWNCLLKTPVDQIKIKIKVEFVISRNPELLLMSGVLLMG